MKFIKDLKEKYDYSPIKKNMLDSNNFIKSPFIMNP